MPGWQKLYEKYKDKNFEILGVSVDIQGTSVMEPYTNGLTFKNVVDSENIIASHYGFKIVPNGIFVNEERNITLIKQGFNVSEESHVLAVEKLINGESKEIYLEDNYYSPKSSQGLETKLAETKFKLAMEYLKNNEKDKALKELDEAILLDGDNFLIRKQRWYIRYPEKFSDNIDVEWQQQQLQKERDQEAKIKGKLECGPQGCIIPGTSRKQ